MTLKKRLSLLEAQLGAKYDANGHDRLAAKLARMEAAVVASGDASDRPSASLIERAVRRYLRGDVGMGDALRDLLAGRWP